MRLTAISLLTTGVLGSAAAWMLLQKPRENAAPVIESKSLATAKARPKVQKQPAANRTAEPAAIVDESQDEHATGLPLVETYQSTLERRATPQKQEAVVLTEQELVARAARVEREATRELQRLVKVLDLTPEQQDRVFEKLVRNSTSWHPGMSVSGAAAAPTPARGGDGTAAGTPPAQVAVGTPGETTAPRDAARIDKIEAATEPVTGKPTIDAISDELTIDQQVALLTDESDRQQWWSEVLTNIQEDIDKETTGTVVKESTGPDVLE